jgi:hypothetical protein
MFEAVCSAVRVPAPIRTDLLTPLYHNGELGIACKHTRGGGCAFLRAFVCVPSFVPSFVCASAEARVRASVQVCACARVQVCACAPIPTYRHSAPVCECAGEGRVRVHACNKIIKFASARPPMGACVRLRGRGVVEGCK